MNISRRILVCIALLSIALVSCQRAPMTNVEEVKKEIAAANSEQVAAFNSKDVNRMTANYAPDAVILPQHGDAVTGRENIESFFKEMSESMSDFQFGSTKVDVSGDLAYEYGSYTGKFGGVDDRGKYLTVWKRQPDGKWKIEADIFNTSMPPQAPPAEEAKPQTKRK
jgi:uncharacterized protein (TIGR02246 family)